MWEWIKDNLLKVILCAIILGVVSSVYHFFHHRYLETATLPITILYHSKPVANAWVFLDDGDSIKTDIYGVASFEDVSKRLHTYKVIYKNIDTAYSVNIYREGLFPIKEDICDTVSKNKTPFKHLEPPGDIAKHTVYKVNSIHSTPALKRTYAKKDTANDNDNEQLLTVNFTNKTDRLDSLSVDGKFIGTLNPGMKVGINLASDTKHYWEDRAHLKNSFIVQATDTNISIYSKKDQIFGHTYSIQEIFPGAHPRQ